MSGLWGWIIKSATVQGRPAEERKQDAIASFIATSKRVAKLESDKIKVVGDVDQINKDVMNERALLYLLTEELGRYGVDVRSIKI